MAAGAIAVAAVALGLLAARLSVGPLSIGSLGPTIAQAVDGLTGCRIRIGEAGLLWRDWRRGLLIDLADVRTTGGSCPATGRIGDLSVAFSPPALARGVLAPVSFSIRDADVALPEDGAPEDRSPDPGRSAGEPGGDGPDAIEGLLAGLRGSERADRPLSFLRDVVLGDVTVRTPPMSGEAWTIKVDHGAFARDASRRLTGNAVLTLSRGTASADATLDLAPAADGDGLGLRLGVSGLRPADFAGAAPALALLAALDFPLGGEVTADLGPEGALIGASTDLKGGEGALVMTADLARTAGLDPASAQRLGVTELSLRASWSAPEQALSVQLADVVFAPGTLLSLPSPVNHRFPLARITAGGGWVGGRLDIPRATLDLDGLKAVLAVDATGVPAAPAGELVVTARDVRVDDFRRYWPASAAPGAQQWCTEHLRDGIVPEVTTRLSFATRDGAVVPTALDTRFGVERLTVDYLPPMPPVRNTTGSATIDLHALRIEVGGGQAGGMDVRGGTIVFPDLESDPPHIELDLTVGGSVRSAMELISHPPLAYTEGIGIDPGQMSGETETRLRLRFPLLDDLDADQIDVHADVDLRDFGVRGVARGVDLSDGDARLTIDGGGLNAVGRIAIAGVPGRLEWRQAFAADADPQTRATFDADHVPVGVARRGLRPLVDLDPYLLDGTFDGKITVLVAPGNRGRVDVTLDTARAGLAVPEIGWRKAAGPAGSLDVALETDAFGVTAVPRAAFVAPGLDLAGSLRMRSDGLLDRLDVDRFISGRTNVSGTLASMPDGSWDLTLGGLGLDLAPLIASAGKREGGGEGAPAPAKADGDALSGLPDLTLAADLETLWLGDGDPVRQLRATVVRRDGTWPLVQVQGKLTDESAVGVTVLPETPSSRSLLVTAADAGEALRALGLYSDMIGGRLEATGRFDDLDPAHPLTGELLIDRFHIVNTPVLARLLGVLSLTGIRDALTGRGIAFSKLDVPFRFRDRVLTVAGGRAYGFALGMTASGELDLRRQTVDMRGELVPFYAINSALGQLPLLGSVMTGGERGGGVLSASYGVTGPLAEPSISVNPVSVLFPGFLRWILETFEGWMAGPVQPLEPDGGWPWGESGDGTGGGS